MARVARYIRNEWPDQAYVEVKPFWSRRLELSLDVGCILWSNRIVVPPQGRKQVLRELHGGHPGTSRMKAMARMFVWWPGMDEAIEQMVKKYSKCQQNRPSPPTAPLQPWQWPMRPWARLHLDFAGPFMGRMFLVIIDAHSKWLEVYPMPSATSHATIQQLHMTFAQFGIPETVVTDNGPCFMGEEFEEFLRKNGVTHNQVITLPSSYKWVGREGRTDL